MGERDTTDSETILDDRYRLGRELGSGGFGAVYEAWDQRVGRTVAIKMLRPDAVDSAALRREALLLASVESPHVVRVLDAVLGGDTAFLVMELLAGRTVRQRLAQDGPFDAAFALRITAELLRGLRALHRRAIVHLDIKPSNVVLSPYGTKLIDLGVSRAGPGAPWDPKHVEGTPPYVAPELLLGQEPDVRADLYGAGLLLYEMLSGHRAYDGSKPRAELIGDIRAGRHVPLRIHCPWLSGIVTSFVRMAVSFDPSDRFANAEEMLEALALVRRNVDTDTKGGSVFPSPVRASAHRWPALAGPIAASRVDALVEDERVRERYLRSGGQEEFFRDLRNRPWIALSEYCRLLDSAYAVLGESELSRITRERVVEETREGPFAAIARSELEELGTIVAAYWKTAFRHAGTVRLEESERGFRLTIVGASARIRSSPGWRAALSGSLMGILDVAGLSGGVRVRDEDGMVSWLADLDGGPSRLVIEAVASPATPSEPLLAGRYQLCRPLGSGSFGLVWEAHDVRLDRPVAIKWIQEDRPVEELRARAAKLAAVTATNVARVLDLELSNDGRPFLVMELLHGPTLASILGDALPIEIVCDIGEAALHGLAALHSAGVVHGAPVPSSVMLTHGHGERVVKWIGFGFRLEGADCTECIPPGYGAPELGRPGASLTPATDVFGVGMILLQLVTGSLPFPPSHYGSAAELRRAMVETPWPVLVELMRVPSAIASVLGPALAPDPTDRYRDATEMLAACASVFHSSSLSSRPPPATTRGPRR